MAARRAPARSAEHPAPRPAPPPPPRAAAPPPPRPAAPPPPRATQAPRAASRPEPRAARAPVPRAASRPPARGSGRAGGVGIHAPARARQGERPDQGGNRAARPAHKPTARPPHKPSGRPQAQDAAAGGGGGDLSGSITQQEIEALRQQVGDLQFGSAWQAANPPKASGRYGIALQGVEVGNNLRVAGRNFAHKIATAAGDTMAAVTLIRNHKPPTYEVKHK